MVNENRYGKRERRKENPKQSPGKQVEGQN